MTESMIERVARAIRDLANSKYGFYVDIDASLELARAAIAAMRKPTPEMLEAGRSGSIDADHAPTSNAWACMIDEALK